VPQQLDEILIDDATWDGASRERRHEWRLALDELLEEHRFDEPLDGGAPLRMLVTVDEGRTVSLDVRRTDGHALARIDLPVDAIGAQLQEYVDICREMGKAGQSEVSPRLEALDIAKRLTHDEAAETLQALCRPLRPDHATCRRLFTLLVTLHYDTTRLHH
jgi:uncharacterized protein (UPF0262 family)